MESAGSNPSTTRTTARRSSGDRAVSVGTVVGAVMVSSQPPVPDNRVGVSQNLWRACGGVDLWTVSGPE